MRAYACAIILLLCLCGDRLEAQETVGGGWPVSQTARRESGKSSIEMISAGPASVRMDPRRLGAKALKTQDGAPVAPPFPVSVPVAIVYPEKAVRRGWEGRAVVAAEILPDGAVGRTALASSSGHEILDNAARDSIKTWKFGLVPAGRQAVPQFVDIPVTFKLEGERDHETG